MNRCPLCSKQVGDTARCPVCGTSLEPPLRSVGRGINHVLTAAGAVCAALMLAGILRLPAEYRGDLKVLVILSIILVLSRALCMSAGLKLLLYRDTERRLLGHHPMTKREYMEVSMFVANFAAALSLFFLLILAIIIWSGNHPLL